MEIAVATALVAAGSAIGGAVVSQLGTIGRIFLDRHKEQQALKLTRLEELSDCVHQSQAWMLRVMEVVRLKGKPVSPAEPIPLAVHARRVHVLSLLYFPSLRAEAHALLDACYQYQGIATNDSISDEDMPRVIKQVEAINMACQQLDALVSEEAAKLL